jgi:CRP-like cAMP-binding protein
MSGKSDRRPHWVSPCPPQPYEDEHRETATDGPICVKACPLPGSYSGPRRLRDHLLPPFCDAGVLVTETWQEQTHSALEPMVRKLRYWCKLDDADGQAILALPYTVKSLERGGYIVREGDSTTSSCVMLSGYSIRHKTVSRGARQIVAIHMKGELVDLQNSLLGVADHSVQMLTNGRVAMIPRGEIIRIAFERPNVGKAMWFDTLVDASIFREWVANVGRRDAPTRLAHLLCEFALRLKVAGLGERTGYELPMTQEELADATGLTAVHVNRTLKALVSEGLIDRPNPRSIHIGDWRKLASAGDFSPAYLHLDERHLA